MHHRAPPSGVPVAGGNDGCGRSASSALTVLGHVHGLTGAEFDRLAEAAEDGCPISRALAGKVALSVEATLDTDS